MEPIYTEITTEDEFGTTHWRFDTSFLTSNWTCIWGRGCLGIGDHPTPELNQGCCSLGAEFGDEDEARATAALAATLGPGIFEFHAEAASGSVFGDERRANTRVVEGACIFLNRPGFAGGEGCALHLQARAVGESPTEWKPSVCWQLPLHVEWEEHPGGAETATMRGWTRQDWGAEGETMAWCCTEGERAYVGDQRVIDSMSDELAAMMPNVVYLELRRRLP